MKNYLVEFIGTFFLVLTIGTCVVNPNSGVIAPLAIGGILAGLIYAGGPISGAHYNPAVSLALSLRGRLLWRVLPGYIGAQLLGAVVAAGAVSYLKGANRTLLDSGGPIYGLSQIALAEFLYTFALVYVILQLGATQAAARNGSDGLAIAATVMAGAFTVGAISGGVFNPAVTLAGWILGLIPGAHFLPYISVQFGAGLAAAWTFRHLKPED